MWTAFDYRYRDAGNFKAFGTVFLRGRFCDSDRRTVCDKLESGEFFIAEQVGIPPLYEPLYEISGGPISDDHCWHEFVALRELDERPASGATIIAASEFVHRFASVTEWDGSLSPHFDVEGLLERAAPSA